VESEAQELSEAVMLGAVMYGHKQMQTVIDGIIRLAEKAAKDPRPLPEDKHAALRNALKAESGPELAPAFQIVAKHERRDAIAAIRKKFAEKYVGEGEGKVAANTYSDLMHDVEAHVMRNAVLDTKKRIDGRDLVTVRPIVAEVGVLPRTHGSALFTRGETQALVTVTLGTKDDEQRIELLEPGETTKRFMLHYNFPPFSVGETGFMRGAGRREIGHGALAERSLTALVPKEDVFPYTMRVVSDILESNGSSSQATVCGASLALMDAGAPLTAHVGGIAMGLVMEGKDYAVLTDIAGAEDHYGDMDFKVAGTRQGITGMQMDIKVPSVTMSILKEALEQARRGRLHILDKMYEAVPQPKTNISQYAPRIYTLHIPTDKIRDVIGPGGKVIRGIIEQTGVKIDVEDDGTVHVASADEASANKAIQIITDITATAEIGKTYLGKVVRLVDFGAFVEIFPGTDGLLHISEIAENRIRDVRDELKEGDQILVKVLALEGNKIKLSRKAVLREQREKLKPTQTH